VEATLEYVKRNHPKYQVQWFGVTLPVQDHGLEWKAPNTNNIIYADVIKDTLPDYVQKSQLVTGDGGFEIESKDRNDQELQNTPLLRGQLQQSYANLAPGGSMVVKMFDMFSQETCDLLWDCYLHFDKVYVIKPLGSRICNSEKYIVGVRYNPKYTGARQLSGIYNLIPDWFYGSVWNTNQRFVELQIKSLTKALRLAATTPLYQLKSLYQDQKKTQVEECLRWLGM
jgi:hypothetical protein